MTTWGRPGNTSRQAWIVAMAGGLWIGAKSWWASNSASTVSSTTRMIGDGRAAVDQSMADHVGHGAGRFTQRTHHFLQRLGMVPHGRHTGFLAGCAAMQREARGFRRGRANALGFAAGQFLFAGHGDQPVLERRTAAVEDEDIHAQISSTVQPHTGIPTRLCAIAAVP